MENTLASNNFVIDEEVIYAAGSRMWKQDHKGNGNGLKVLENPSDGKSKKKPDTFT